MTTHFTAVVEIHKRTKTEEKKDQYNRVETIGEDSKKEITRIIVRANTLESLLVKVKSHVDLVSEE
jgi:hypothetical protein